MDRLALGAVAKRAPQNVSLLEELMDGKMAQALVGAVILEPVLEMLF